jgi:hypothetical protein
LATYKVIADLFVMPGSIYASAGDTISDGPGGILPVGWQPPTGAVDPITSDAIQAYWNVGPRGQTDAEPNKWSSPWGWSRWANTTYSAPAIYWKPAPGGFILTGAGAVLGVHPLAF